MNFFTGLLQAIFPIKREEIDCVAFPSLCYITSWRKAWEFDPGYRWVGELIQYDGVNVRALDDARLYHCCGCKICLLRSNQRIVVFPNSFMCYSCWYSYKHLYRLWLVREVLPMEKEIVYHIQYLLLHSIKYNIEYRDSCEESTEMTNKFCQAARDYPILDIPYLRKYSTGDDWDWFIGLGHFNVQVRVGNIKVYSAIMGVPSSPKEYNHIHDVLDMIQRLIDEQKKKEVLS